MISETFEQILQRRLKRRDFVKSAVGTLLLQSLPLSAAPSDGLAFIPISPNTLDVVSISIASLSRRKTNSSATTVTLSGSFRFPHPRSLEEEMRPDRARCLLLTGVCSR